MPGESDIDKYISSTYGPNGRLKDWGAGTQELSTHVSRALSHILEEEGLVGESALPKILFSPTANTGNIELGLKKRLGDKVTIYAGDLSDVKPPENEIPFVKLNARKMPLPDSSVDILLDLKGATWYYITSQNTDKLKELLAEYYRVVKHGGAVVIDAPAASVLVRNKIQSQDIEFDLKDIKDTKLGMYLVGIARVAKPIVK